MKIQFQTDGSLEIVGTSKSFKYSGVTEVAFIASNVLCINQGHLRQAIKDNFKGECIVVEDQKTLAVRCFFTYEVSGNEIRNPEGLLRDVRSRLIRVIQDIDLN